MLPIRYETGALATASVLDEVQLATTKDTVLDPELEQTGAWMQLPIPCNDYVNRPIQQVWFPPSPALRENGQVVLDHMQSAAQMLLCAIDGFLCKRTKNTQLVTSVRSYQLQAIRTLFGKDGFINQHLVSVRMRRTGRAVLLATPGGSPFNCIAPISMMKQLGIRDGDPVIIGRDPTIWEGSVEALNCYGGKDDVIRLHPIVFGQLGADSDGDTVWLLGLNRDCHEEAQKHIGQFMQRHAKYPVPYAHDGAEINWETVEEEMYLRARPTGFSVGPEDVLTDTGVMNQVQIITGKDLTDECRRVAQGLSLEEWKKLILHMNQAQLTMKVGMGPVGAAGMALRIIAGDHPRKKKAAGAVSERLSQLLLSAKNARDTGCQYSHVAALDILQKRGEAASMSGEDAAKKIAGILGLRPRDVRPIIHYLYSRTENLSGLIRADYPLYAATTQTADDTRTALGLAISIFHHKNIDPDGAMKFVMNALIALEEQVVEV